MLAIGFSFWPAQSRAATLIVADGFSGTNGTSIDGRAPDTANLAGDTWHNRDYFAQPTTAIDTTAGSPSPSAVGSSNNLSFISIASAGAYSKPSTLHISGDLQLGNLQAFVALGFLIQDPGDSTNINHLGTDDGLNGIEFESDGTLNLRTSTACCNGASPQHLTLIHTYDAADLGAFDASAFYSLAYDVDTVSGDISNITLSSATGSVTYDAVATTFTAANTNLATFATGSLPADRFGHVDNFAVSYVPEPSALGVSGAGVIGLLGRRRRGFGRLKRADISVVPIRI